MSRAITIDVPSSEVTLDLADAIDMVVSESSIEYVVEHLGRGECMACINTPYVIDWYGEEELLSHISDNAIEEEFYKRSPLGQVMSEN